MSETPRELPTWATVAIVVGVVSIMLGVVVALLIGAHALMS